MNSKKLLPILLILILALIAWMTYYATSARAIVLQGEVEANRVDISARIQGRAAQINYNVGQDVKKGDVLLELSSPALLAQRDYVKSQLEVAIANRNITYSTRQENIDAQKAALEKSQADLTLAQQSYNRLEKLAAKNLISNQQFDEAKNQLQVATKATQAAKANYDLAVNGNSDEVKALADAQVKQAETALAQINIDIQELIVRSPIDGQITARIAELGQLYNPGTPLFSLINLDDVWLTFNVREDLLNNTKLGDQYQIMIPALNRKITVKITAINALGQYANWRATKATGDFDLKTFEVRAQPVEKIAGLRPGMSATISLKAN
ncbi:efflux RND transporter periplasmic adaptor subunit [Utexia brackfieldae]|uniref:HlyD family secretion protein n=1 Tax=Utexia brackfieldae TaxID=3074108 RepID=UPI00370D7956